MADELLPPDTTEAAEPVALPWDKELWQGAIQASRDESKRRVRRGRDNVDAYLVKDMLEHRTEEDVAVVPNDYIYTEAKKALLFYQVPNVNLKAERAESRQNAPIFSAVLNQRILPKAHVGELMDRLLMDVICPMGFGACKIGYEGVTETVEQPAPPDPMTGIPPLDPATGQPVMQPVTRTISEHFYADRIPPGRLLKPVDFLGGNFNEAAWIGYDYYESLPPGSTGKSGGDDERDMLLTPKNKRDYNQRSKTPRRRRTQIWYKARAVDPNAHPDLIRYFDWAENEDAPSVHADSPNQSIRPDGTMGGLLGYPVKVLTTRDLPDSATPPSDCDITRATFDEISRGHTQLLQGRDRNLPQTGYDGTRIHGETQAAIEKNINSAWVRFNGPITDDLVRPLNKPHINQENYAFGDRSDRISERAWALGPNQQGTSGAGGGRTATEMQIIQQNSDTRLDKERKRVISWFCDELVQGLAVLVQQFASLYDFIELEGEEGARSYAQWDRTRIQGNFTYWVQADAALRHDAAQTRQMALDFYNLTANDPYLKRQEVTRILVEAFGWDYGRLQAPPPQPPEPEKPKVSISLKVELVDLLNPLIGPIAAKLIAGEKVTMADMQALQTPAPGQLPHGGPVTPAQPINKHLLDESHALPGMGSVVESTGGAGLPQ